MPAAGGAVAASSDQLPFASMPVTAESFSDSKPRFRERWLLGLDQFRDIRYWK